MEKRYKVPEGMLKAALLDKGHLVWMEATKAPLSQSQYEQLVKEVLKAAIRWLSENPIVPNEDHAKSIIVDLNDSGYCISDATGDAKSITTKNMVDAGRIVAESWQHRMFLEPEPEILEAVKDLLGDEYSGDGRMNVACSNKNILEAYRRGRQSNIGRS